MARSKMVANSWSSSSIFTPMFFSSCCLARVPMFLCRESVPHEPGKGLAPVEACLIQQPVGLFQVPGVLHRVGHVVVVGQRVPGTVHVPEARPRGYDLVRRGHPGARREGGAHPGLALVVRVYEVQAVKGQVDGPPDVGVVQGRLGVVEGEARRRRWRPGSGP